MAYAQHAGLANPSCQLYMLFYYIGPALAAFSLRCGGGGGGGGGRRHRRNRSKGGSRCRTGEERVSGADNDERGDTTIPLTTISYGSTCDIQQVVDDEDFCIDDKDVTVALVDGDNDDDDYYEENYDEERSWPSRQLFIKASAIALFDIFAQSMVYTGASSL